MRLQTWPWKNLPLDLYLLPSVPHFCPSPSVLGPSLLTENPVRAFPKSLLRRVSRSLLPSLTLVVDCVSHHSFLFSFFQFYTWLVSLAINSCCLTQPDTGQWWLFIGAGEGPLWSSEGLSDLVILLFTEATEVNLRSHPNTDSKWGNEVLLLIQSASLGRNTDRMA